MAEFEGVFLNSRDSPSDFRSGPEAAHDGSEIAGGMDIL
jgi:hypothetical protein